MKFYIQLCLKILDYLVGAAFFGLVFAGVPWVAWRDFRSPDPWGEGTNNPLIYLPVMATVWCFCLYLVATIVPAERTAWRRARVDWLLRKVERLMRDRKFEEAEACLRKCKRLTGCGDRRHDSGQGGAS